jgi:hypothetical protein
LLSHLAQLLHTGPDEDDNDVTASLDNNSLQLTMTTMMKKKQIPSLMMKAMM